MKKLNNKGFTLIELLAIIVILAIIMVVTIPTVLDTISTSRERTFANGANTIADWVEKQYTLAVLGDAEDAFEKVCTPTSGYCKTTQIPPITNLTADVNKKFLTAAGVVPGNYSKVEISFVGERACVTLYSNPDKDFKGIVANSELGITLETDGKTAKVSSNSCK